MSLRHVLLSVVLGVVAMSTQAADANHDWITPAEAAQFRTTPSYADMLAYLRATATTIFHPTSTCRMGSDATAVVDERLRVRGIAGLRVIDGAVMPTVVSGNTNAAIIMIAEKGADMILQDAKSGVARAA